MSTEGQGRTPRNFSEIEDLENIAAAANAADEDARILALLATTEEQLVAADRLRTRLALILTIVHRRRQIYRRK